MYILLTFRAREITVDGFDEGIVGQRFFSFRVFGCFDNLYTQTVFLEVRMVIFYYSYYDCLAGRSYDNYACAAYGRQQSFVYFVLIL